MAERKKWKRTQIATAIMRSKIMFFRIPDPANLIPDPNIGYSDT